MINILARALRFNLSPAKGLLFLEGKGLLEHTPAGIAKFLHTYAGTVHAKNAHASLISAVYVLRL